MPGSLDNNLRRAYLQEELGVYLLRGFAAVAAVERPQDFGIDAIATILRPSTSRKLLAEDTFYVQLKAGSVRDVPFDDSQLAWYRQLDLPYFIGSVDPQRGELSLHPCFAVDKFFSEGHTDRSITLRLGKAEESFTYSPVNVTREGEPGVVYLGEPLLRFGLSEVQQSDFVSHAYAVLKPYLQHQKINIQTRKLNLLSGILWQTNRPALLSGGSAASPSDHDSLRTLIEELKPRLELLFMSSLNRQDYHFADWLAGVGEHLGRWGFDAKMPTFLIEATRQALSRQGTP
jgi:hypothetical protein